MSKAACSNEMPVTKRKLLDSAMRLMLRQGFTATTVDQVCAESGLTKGSFFHYFKTKDQIGEAAVELFSCCQREAQERAGFNKLDDPLQRLFGMLDFFAASVRGKSAMKACLVGNLTQELAQTNSGIRSCCEMNFNQWTSNIAGMLKEAKQSHPPASDFDPESVANLILSLMQGSLLLAKAKQNVTVIEQNIEHCRAYLKSLFGPETITGR